MTPRAAPDQDVEAFLSSLEHPRHEEILRAFGSRPMLTVGLVAGAQSVGIMVLGRDDPEQAYELIARIGVDPEWPIDWRPA